MRSIIGEKIGKVIILKELPSIKDSDGRFREIYECKCECGNILNIRGDLLKYQDRNYQCKECLLKFQREINVENLVDHVFGSLVVVKEGEKTKDGRVTWVCQCSCGSEPFSVRASKLKSGTKTMCKKCSSKIKSENSLIDLSGESFGFLTVIELDRIEKKNGAFWKCHCDPELGGCGKYITVSRVALNRGQFSCGCSIESFIATKVKGYFKEKHNSISEYSDLKNPETNRPLKYDIYVPSKKVYIEINGSQHYVFNSYHYKNKNDFINRKNLDKIKKTNAKRKGFFIEVDIRRFKSYVEVIEFLENKMEKIL